MTRAFFDQIDDELRGFVGPALRDFQSLRTSTLVKLWFADPAVHFEAQRLSLRWAPDPAHRYEVGLHLEHPTAARNDEILGALTAPARTKAWRGALPSAVGGGAIGPRASTWRRLSELVEGEDTDDPDLAGEIAERLAAYVKTLEPMLRGIR